jgi:hypothetical protein
MRTQPQLRFSRPRSPSSSIGSALIAGQPGVATLATCAVRLLWPSEQHRWRDPESSPPLTRRQPAECSKKGAVGLFAPDAPIELALKDTHLVTWEKQLHGLVHVVGPRQRVRGHGRAVGTRERRPPADVDGSGRPAPAQSPDRNWAAFICCTQLSDLPPRCPGASAFAPAKSALEPRACSIQRRRFHLAVRSERVVDPTLI